MTARHLLVLMLLAVLVAPVLRAEPGEAPEIDIMKVSPDQLGGVDVRALAGKANAAYGEKRYEDAARIYIQALTLKPGDSNSLYNLACCYGLLEATDQAVAFLEASYRAGFRDLGHIKSDADFDKVRKTDAFKALIARFEEQDKKDAAARGELLEVVAPSVATVRVLAPKKMESWQRFPLVIGLHGYGDNSENFAGLFLKRGIEQPFIFVAVQAPYASHGGERIGFSWGFATQGGNRKMGISSHLATEQYVLNVIEAVKRAYPVDERNIFLMGFSQGAGQSFSIGLKHPDLFRGVIPIGGWVQAGEHPRARMDHAAKNSLFLICHSPEDRMVEYERCNEAKKLFNEHDVPHAVLDYPGGHSLPVPLMKAIAAWIADPKAEAPTLPVAEKASLEKDG
jgi:phospholipase/carboxylesterase